MPEPTFRQVLLIAAAHGSAAAAAMYPSVVTLGEYEPPRDNTRESSKSVHSGRTAHD